MRNRTIKKRGYTRRMTLRRSKNRILRSRVGRRKMRGIEYNPFMEGVGKKVKSLSDLKKTVSLEPSIFRIVWIYAEWCGHCRAFLPTWKSLVEEFTNVEFIVLDGDSDQSEIDNAAALGLPSITGYPTIWLFDKDVEGPKRYNDARDIGSMRKLLQNK